MKIWLIFIDSNDEFQTINSYLKNQNREFVYNIIYYVIEGPIKTKEGQVFGKENEILLAISFYTYEDHPITEMKAKRIVKNSSNVIIIDDLDSNELSLEDGFENECYIKKGKSYFTEGELYENLEKIKISKFDLIKPV